MAGPFRILLRAGIALAAMVALAGCASVPHASRERDAEAKRFLTHPNAATLYVYRNDYPVGAQDLQDSDLYVDGRLIGATLSRTFFRIDLRPGRHVLYGYANDQGRLGIEARPGEIYFISLTVANGNSHFVRVSPETGKREIMRCCVMLENWTPGQRPLLR